MRPLHLRFAGIGSYPGTVDIDFRTLNSKGLYLIVGPTGAGKTTILDAMTFALYGKVPSDREGSLTSLYPTRNKPFIEFEFSHGDRTYLIRREPGLPNKQAQTNKQLIRIFDAAGTEIETKTGSVQVSKECTEITGLNAEEFAQVILLPQGKFQKFLTAKGAEKRAILQTIFGTSIYNQVVDRLKNAAKGLEESVATARASLDNKAAIVQSNIESVEEIDTIEISTEMQDDVSALIEYLTGQQSHLAQRAKDSKTIDTQLKIDLKNAEREADRFDKSEQLTELRKVHGPERARIDKVRTRLADHVASLPIAEAISSREDLKANVKESRTAVEKTRAEITRIAKKFKVMPEVTKNLVDAIPTASPTTLSQEHAKVVAAIEKAEAAYDEIADVSSQITDNKSEVADASKELAGLEKELIAEQARETKSKQALSNARAAVKGLPKAQKDARELEDLLSKSDVQSATKQVEDATESLKKAQSRYDKCEEAFRKAQANRTKELAGELAADLASGDACPVCGSTDHPSKAKRSTAAAVDVESAEKARDDATRVRTIAERELKDAQRDLEDAKAHSTKLPSSTEQKRIMKVVEDLEQVNSSLPELENDFEEVTDAVAAVKEEISEAKRNNTRLTTEGRNLASRKSKLEESVSPIGSLRDVTASLEACSEIGQLIDDLESEVKDLGTIEGKEKQATLAAASALSASTFKTEKEALAAELDEDEFDDLTEFVKNFDKREREIDKLEAAIGPDPVAKSRPDVDELAERAKAADAASTEAANTANTVKNALAQIKAAYKEMLIIGPTIEQQTTEAQKARSMTSVFEKGAGATSQLSLETWVQRTLFEEVCLVANTQLRMLSSNRYSLTLEQEEGGISKSNASGLDIYVLDGHGIGTRPVHTLSGGEQFLASLALALALAEVVQQHAGGIELPCLFIDEGFGGLDPESLDLAINVLSGLHAAGRTVGIITHVEMMQEQLPIGIRVTKADSGSTLEVLN